MTLAARMLRHIETAVLVLACVATVVIMLYAACWKFEWSGFYPWATTPYVVYLLISRAFGRFVPSSALAGCIVAILMLAFTLVVYIDAMFIHVSSTSALVFIFVPLYLLVGGPLLLLIVWVLGNIVRRFYIFFSSHLKRISPF